MSVTLVDRQPTVPATAIEQFSKLGWQAEAAAADVFDWLRSTQRADVIFANLFLHHFPDETLAEMFSWIAQRTDLLLACETRRSAPSFLVSRLLLLLGCNAVTRHDAVLSMRAGFRAKELSALWPDRNSWKVEERRAILFTHLFVAQREA